MIRPPTTTFPEPETASSAVSPSIAPYRGWAVVVLAFFMLLLGAGPVYYAYGNYAVAFADEFGASRTTINIGYTMVLLLGNIGSAPVGMLADRWPIRRLASLGVIGTSAGFLAIAFADGIWTIILLFSTLIALADICIGTVVTNYLVSHWFERRRGLAIGLSVLGASAAAVIFPPLTDLLITAHGWRMTFAIYAGLFAALLPFVWWIARVPAAIPLFERKVGQAPTPDTKLTLREIFRSPAFWVISMVVGAMIGANAAAMVSMVGFAASRGFDTLAGSTLISALGAAAMIGKIGFGFAADRTSLRTALRMGVLCQLVAMTVMAIAVDFRLLLAAAVLFGVGLGGMLPVWGAAIARQFGLASYGRALGWSRAVMAPVSMACPIAAGMIFDATGDYAAAWGGIATLLAAALLITAGWREKRGTD